MSQHETHRQTIGRFGGHKSWANTPDRTARTLNGRKAGPSGLDWHIARLDPEKFADATREQREAAAEAARSAYYTELAMRSAIARRRGGDAA